MEANVAIPAALIGDPVARRCCWLCWMTAACRLRRLPGRRVCRRRRRATIWQNSLLAGCSRLPRRAATGITAWPGRKWRVRWKLWRCWGRLRPCWSASLAPKPAGYVPRGRATTIWRDSSGLLWRMRWNSAGSSPLRPRTLYALGSGVPLSGAVGGGACPPWGGA